MQTGKPDHALRQRLLMLLKHHSRTALAAKTGTSLANVSRYASGTRMPASFCAALITGLGVNPAWLLTGEGTPFTADVTAGTQKMAGNLLELVEGMNAVTRMRLGSLAGKHHLKVLRELNEALTRYEGLRAKLNEHSREIFSGMLGDLRRALERMDLDRAVEIRKAAQQVARLSEDEPLLREFARLQAHVEFLQRNYGHALEFQRQVFLQSVLSRRPLAESDFEELARHALTLKQMLRARDALTVIDVALRLLRDDAALGVAHWMRFLRGELLADTGDLRQGLAAMLEHYPKLAGKRKSAGEASLMLAFLASGTMSFAQALSFGADIETKAQLLVNFAVCMEDLGALKTALDYRSSARVAKVARPDAGDGAHRLLRAARGDRSALVEHAAQFAQESGKHTPAQTRAIWLIDLCQLARVCGWRQKAGEYFAAAARALREMPGDCVLPFTIEGVHWRNALELSIDVSRAHDWLKRKVSKGFACFYGLLELAKAGAS